MMADYDTGAMLDRIVELEAQLEKVTAERDEWQRIVGKRAASVPISKALAATATLGDLVQYFKDLHTRADLPATDKQAMQNEKVIALVEASNRQMDNMAFILNHMDVKQWYEKFIEELAQDRAALAALETDDETN